MELAHGWLIVIQVNMTGTAGEKEHDYAFGLGGEMRHAKQAASSVGLWLGGN